MGARERHLEGRRREGKRDVPLAYRDERTKKHKNGSP